MIDEDSEAESAKNLLDPNDYERKDTARDKKRTDKQLKFFKKT